MEKHSLNDGDKFCAALMRESSRHKTLGMVFIPDQIYDMIGAFKEK